MDYAQISSIVFFAAVFSGIGSGLRALLRLPEEDVVQETVLSFLFGLAAFIPITLLIGILHIPIHWITYLLIAIVGATYRTFFASDGRKQTTRAKKRDAWYDMIDWHLIIVIVLAVTLAAVMYKGATSYPYLEDDDPWVHAEGAAYVAEKLTFWQTPGQVFTRYIAPYTPFYTTMMGVLAQVSHDIPWTLKFFNSALVGLMLIPAYLFFAAFTKNRTAAAIMTAMLMMLPSFAGHFIWAQTYGLITFFIAFHALVKAGEDKRWLWWAIIAVCATFISNPLAIIYGGLFFATFWAGMVLYRVMNRGSLRDPALWRVFIICGIGVATALLYWGSMYLVYGNDALTSGLSLNIENGRIIPGDTSGQVKYTFGDFWNAPTSSHIDQATGLGAAMVILVICGVMLALLKAREIRKKEWMIISLVWLAASIVHINGNRIAPHILIGAHRFWPWLSVAVVLMAGFAVITLVNSMKSWHAKSAIVIVVLVWIAFTAGYPKYVVQTSQWPPGVSWTAAEEISGYASMGQAIPRNSRVFPMCNFDRNVIGFGMRSDPWDPEVVSFRKTIANATADEIFSFLQRHEYTYITMDATCVRTMGENATIDLAQRLSASQRTTQVISAPGFLLAQAR